MSNPMTNLVLDLIKSIKDISSADATEFSAAIKDSFESCSTFESYLTGISERQYVYCISQCLQQASENAQSTDLAPFLWNPIIAVLMKCITTLAHRQPHGSTPSSLPLGTASSSNRKPAHPKVNHPPKSGNKTNSTNQPSTKTVQKVVVKPSEQKPKGVKPPSDKPVAKVNAQHRLTAYSQTRSVRKEQPLPFFNQMKGSRGCPVTCKATDCSTCEKIFLQLPLTKCADIRCHRVGSCTKSGWYPHVLPHIWANVIKAHTSPGHEVKFHGLPESLPGLEPNLVSEPEPSTSSSLPKKRKWTLSRLSENSDCESDSSAKTIVYGRSSPVYDSSCDPWPVPSPTSPAEVME